MPYASGIPTPSDTPTRHPHRRARRANGATGSTTPAGTIGSGKNATARPSTGSPRCSSTGTATGSGARPAPCLTRARPLRPRIGRRPSAAAPSRPTSPPAERLPVPKPLSRLRPLPHRRLLPARSDRLPRGPAPHPRAARRTAGGEDWARAAASPAPTGNRQDPRAHQPHQGRHRRHWHPMSEGTRIDEAVAVIRRHRAVSLGMPRLRHAASRQEGTGT